MTLKALIESTHGERPGYADAANDCLVEVVEPENAEEWLVAAMVFSMLAVAEELRRLVAIGESNATRQKMGLA